MLRPTQIEGHVGHGTQILQSASLELLLSAHFVHRLDCGRLEGGSRGVYDPTVPYSL